jgi:hypothetical protein
VKGAVLNTTRHLHLRAGLAMLDGTLTAAASRSRKRLILRSLRRA